MVEYSNIEFLAACASRHVKDKENVFGGTGLPLLAALLAKETHAPNSNLISEAGFIDARPKNVPLSVADTRYYLGCSAFGNSAEMLRLNAHKSQFKREFNAYQAEEYA